MAYQIIQVSRDDETIRKYVERYKAFRLLALKVAPLSFGSTFKTESAFTDEMWYNRLANPQAVTFLALHGDVVTGSLTAVGPLPFTPEELLFSGNPWTSLDGHVPEELTYSHWRVNGMFVSPEARGQGIAKALMTRVLTFTKEEASRTGKEFAGSIIVDSDNLAAKTLYEKAGYVTIRGEELGDDAGRTALLMKYLPGQAKDN
ncbi:hypothetical protein LSUE1_G000422 [Lachnellula suecica]|uniref:N-acetyltransferase domain-containing protein n=1 Tax=Lachnellula suecica TaxID=602035 RepID=A0A8T9CI55_9HELO|nr:hypothetical protein LSUE1_G000422 [Lachnellula suecica]